MSQQVRTTSRDAVRVEDAALLRMMGLPVLEAVPSRGRYALTDPFILVHEGRFRPSEMAGKDTRHPHQGFDNLWYVLQGSASTGHSTGPGGSIERARLSEGSLLWLKDGTRRLARRGGGSRRGRRRPGRHRVQACCSGSTWPARTSRPSRAPWCCTASRSRCARRATPRFGSWSVRARPCSWDTGADPGRPRRLPAGGQLTTPVPPEFQGFAYLVDGEAVFGANKRQARPPNWSCSVPGRRPHGHGRHPRHAVHADGGQALRGGTPCSTDHLWTRTSDGSSGPAGT